YLTEFLLHDDYAHRHFEIYVKPTLGHSAFDFIVLEPNRAIYIIQTPENFEQFQVGDETFNYFMLQRLYTLSPTFHRRIQQTIQEKQSEKKQFLIKQLFYIYEETYLEKFSTDDLEKNILITSEDFQTYSSTLKSIFSAQESSEDRKSVV